MCVTVTMEVTKRDEGLAQRRANKDEGNKRIPRPPDMHQVRGDWSKPKGFRGCVTKKLKLRECEMHLNILMA